MNNAWLLIFPLINVVVTALFAGTILRQYVQRHRIYQLFWSVALSMGFLGTLAYVLMVAAGPTSSAGVVFFRLYYILGAGLTPSWLGMGSVALVASKRIRNICLALLCVLSLLAIIFIGLAGIDMQQLGHVAGTPGTSILLPAFGAWTLTIIIANTLGVLAVVGVALYSAWKLVRRQATVAGFHAGNLFWANILIVVGDLLNGLAGATARVFGNGFWLIMALGWIVFFSGVLLTSAARSRRPATETKQAMETGQA
jgi:hypothetical protein